LCLTQNFPQDGDVIGEVCLLDERVGPEAAHHLLFCNHVPAVLDQEKQRLLISPSVSLKSIGIPFEKTWSQSRGSLGLLLWSTGTVWQRGQPVMFASDGPMSAILRFGDASINKWSSAGSPSAWFQLKALTLMMVFSPGMSLALAQNPTESEIAHAEFAFAGKSLTEINVVLAAKRPPPVSPANKSKLMRNLPLVTARNRVEDQRELDGLHSRLQRTLNFYARSGVVDLILFRDSRPIVYSKPGVVVVISNEVMKIVGDDDAALVGIIAHELAHEYVALQMLRALQSGDLTKIRELELFCDAVAVVALLNLGLDPRSYARALQRIATHSQASAQLNNGSRSHPAIEARLKVISDISALPNLHSDRSAGLSRQTGVLP
jgi:Zn-dependent protease with chaperone function